MKREKISVRIEVLQSGGGGGYGQLKVTPNNIFNAKMTFSAQPFLLSQHESVLLGY